MTKTQPFIGIAALLVAGVVVVAGCHGRKPELETGLAAFEKGDYPAAVRHFQRAAQRDHDATAYCNLGLAYWRMGATDDAIDALTMAADLESGDARPLLLLAEVLQDGGRWDAARDVMNKLQSGLPDNAELMTRAARLEYRAKNMDAAQALLESALKADPQYAPALYNMAVLARDRHGEPIVAMRYLSRYLTVATDQVRIDHVHEELARLRQPLRPAAPSSMSAAASEELPVPTGALVEDAPSAVRLLEKARAAIEAQAYDEALVLLGQARSMDASNADVVWTLAGLYDLQLQQPRKAEGALRDLIARWPDDPRAALARRRLDAAAPPQASATTRASAAVEAPIVTSTTTSTSTTSTTAPRARPTLAAVWQQAQDAHTARRWDDAVALYEAVLQLDPKFAGAAYNMGLAQKERGDLDRARDAFARATQLDPRMSKAFYMRAVVERERGERDAAIASAKQSLALQPRDDRSHYLLGLLYREAMRYDLARAHFQSALELARDRAAAEKARAGLDSVAATRTRR